MSRVRLTPLLHPAAVVRGRWAMEQPQIDYLRRLAANPYPAVPDVSQPPPHTTLYPTLEDLRAFRKHLDAYGAVAIDLEQVGPWPICVGMTAVGLDLGGIGGTLCLRIRTRGGDPYWNEPAHLAVTRWLYDMLRDPALTKVFHFGLNADIPWLTHMGFQVRGRIIDTAVLAHAAYTELPKGLQFLSTLFLGAPVWKTLTDVEDEEEEGKA